MNSLPPPTGEAPHVDALPPPTPRTISSVAFIERHGAEAPSLAPKPSRRRGWLIGWILLALVGLAAVVFALTRGDGGDEDPSLRDVPAPRVTPDPALDGDIEPDVFEPAERGDQDPVDDLDTEPDPDAVADDATPDDDAGEADESPNPLDERFGEDFEPATSINPPVTLGAADTDG